MNLDEIKHFAQYARKAGIKRLKIDGLELEMHDPKIIPRAARKPKPVPGLDPIAITPAPELTLEQINQYIYGDGDEVG